MFYLHCKSKYYFDTENMFYNIKAEGEASSPQRNALRSLHNLSVALLLSSNMRVEGACLRNPVRLEEEDTAYKLGKSVGYLCSNFDGTFNIIVFLSLLIIELKLPALIL